LGKKQKQTELVYYSPQDIAAILSTTNVHVRNLIEAKKLKAVNVGVSGEAYRVWRVRKDHFEEWMMSGQNWQEE